MPRATSTSCLVEVMRACIASSVCVVNNHAISATIGTMKAREMMNAFEAKRRRRKSRTPGAQTPW